jgi:opacity protein-like surface antigen
LLRCATTSGRRLWSEVYACLSEVESALTFALVVNPTFGLWPGRHWHFRIPASIVWPMMTVFKSACGSVFVGLFGFAALSLAAPAAHAQSVPYWTTTTGFGTALTSDLNAIRYNDVPSRFNLGNGWFIGSQSGNFGLGATSFSSAGSFSSTTSFLNPAVSSYQSVQTGYNFQSAPVSVYAGLDTVKYTSPIGSPFAGLDSMSSNSAASYNVRAGVEFRPTSNLSLSLGVGYAQQPSDLNSALLPGASPLGFGRRY